MSLLVYECQRADHGHEIRQFGEIARNLREYYDDRKELALLVGNINIGKINLDGLIIKHDAIIILEMKDRSGSVVARNNGDWTCDSEIIKGGGSGKSVFEQLKVNQRELKMFFKNSRMFSLAQTNDIQGLVVFSELKAFSNELDRENKQWVHVSDVRSVGNAMHDIKARSFYDYKNDEHVDAVFTKESICAFIRGIKLQESALVTDLSDTNLLPSDLFHKDAPHNGKSFSTAAQLADKTAEVESLKVKLEELTLKLEIRNLDHEKELNEKLAVINRQKSELLEAKEQHILDEKTAMEEMLKSETAEQEVKSIKAKLAEVELRAERLAAEKEKFKQQLDEARRLSSHSGTSDEELKQEVEQLKKELVSRVAALPTDETGDRKPADPRKIIFGKKAKLAAKKDWDIGEGSMDDEQLDLIDRTLDKSMLVAGCAGSGKSVIAMNKAVKIKEAGGDVIMIALTKSLNRYMGYGKESHGLGARFYYHWQWAKEGKPGADYVIVDEIQDFTRNQIEDFIKAANKSYFFFGDTAQSIYRSFGVNTMTIDEISEMTGINPLFLYNNYRLPRGVAKITQPYVAVGANEYNERIYQSKEKSIPYIVSCPTFDSQIKKMAAVIVKNKLKNVGIFLPSNEGVLKVFELLTDLEIECEFKYSKKRDYESCRDTLDFKTKLPKIMTYHSAKGLQFETVFLPGYDGARSEEDRKALYVAMTRTWRDLYVFYTGELKAPLCDVAKELYLKEA